MAYKQHQDGGFRLRASFPMDRDLMLKANAVCEILGVSMYALCRDAVRQYCEQQLAADLSGVADSAKTSPAVQ